MDTSPANPRQIAANPKPSNTRAQINPTGSARRYTGALMFITKADPVHIANAWRRVRAMFVRVSDIVGAISALAVCVALTSARRREIASSIALVESILRKLIFIEAANLHRAESAGAQRDRPSRVKVTTPPSPDGSPRLLPRMRRGARRSNLQAFDPTQPQTWRVRFKLTPPRDPHAREESGAPSRPQPAQRRRTPEPLRLALRFEALRRAIADPAPHARRLARILPRLCRRNHNAAERYAVAPAHFSRCDPGDPRLIVEVIALALWVAPYFVNSG